MTSRQSRAGRWSVVWFGLALILHLFLLPRGPSTPVGASESGALATPTPGTAPLSTSEAIELIWYGEYERAEAALLEHLNRAQENREKAEILVYLALLSSIRRDLDEASELLMEAVVLVPGGIELDPVQFPPRLRSLLETAQQEQRQLRPVPEPGTLDDPIHVLAPPGTPPAGPARKKWYQRWYVWAGVGVVATIAVLALSSGGDPEPTATPTVTPTFFPTPTPTPGEQVYTRVINQNPDKTGFNGPNRGVTYHEFELGVLGREIILHEASLRVLIQGDYGPQISDDQDKEADILIERFQPNYAIGPSAAFCSSVERILLHGDEAPNTNFRQQLLDSLNEPSSPRVIVVEVRPGEDVIENDRGGCNALHQVALTVRYSFR